ncbi:MAG: hypothetical protein RI947_341 [Candidatus Parcubacteria bacterium]|jgi:ribosomal protein L29
MRKLTAELSKIKSTDMNKQIISVREEIAKLKLEEKVNPQKDTNLIAKKKKRLAVLLTLFSQTKEPVQTQKD